MKSLAILIWVFLLKHAAQAQPWMPPVDTNNPGTNIYTGPVGTNPVYIAYSLKVLDPTNLPTLQFTGVTPGYGNGELICNSPSNEICYLQYSPDLVQPFQDVTPILNGQCYDYFGDTNQHGFYRLRIQPTRFYVQFLAPPAGSPDTNPPAQVMVVPEWTFSHGEYYYFDDTAKFTQIYTNELLTPLYSECMTNNTNAFISAWIYAVYDNGSNAASVIVAPVWMGPYVNGFTFEPNLIFREYYHTNLNFSPNAQPHLSCYTFPAQFNSLFSGAAPFSPQTSTLPFSGGTTNPSWLPVLTGTTNNIGVGPLAPVLSWPVTTGPTYTNNPVTILNNFPIYNSTNTPAVPPYSWPQTFPVVWENDPNPQNMPHANPIAISGSGGLYDWICYGAALKMGQIEGIGGTYGYPTIMSPPQSEFLSPPTVGAVPNPPTYGGFNNDPNGAAGSPVGIGGYNGNP